MSDLARVPVTQQPTQQSGDFLRKGQPGVALSVFLDEDCVKPDGMDRIWGHGAFIGRQDGQDGQDLAALNPPDPMRTANHKQRTADRIDRMNRMDRFSSPVSASRVVQKG